MQIYGNATLSSVSLYLVGDGISNSATIDLTKAPFALAFLGSFPSALAYSLSSGVSGVAVSGNGLVTITLSSVLAVNAIINQAFTLVFPAATSSSNV